MQKQEDTGALEAQPREIGVAASPDEHANRSRLSGDRLAPQHPLDIETRTIASLTLRRRNPRTHSEKQVRQIAHSIETFGFTNPVLIDSSGTVIAGHGRVRAAKLLGLQAVPTLTLEHLTEAQIRASGVAWRRGR